MSISLERFIFLLDLMVWYTVTIKQHQPVASLNFLENNNNHVGLKDGHTEHLPIKHNKIWW